MKGNQRNPVIPKGKGRPKGSPNKHTAALKDMIREALERVGGAAYLQRQAEENPSAFMALLGRIIPMELAGKATVTYKLVNAIPEDRPLLVLDEEDTSHSDSD